MWFPPTNGKEALEGFGAGNCCFIIFSPGRIDFYNHVHVKYW